MKIRSLFIALCIFLGSSVYAQSYYEMLCYINYDSDKYEFKTFLLINGDGTGTMRLYLPEKNF